MIRGKGAPQLGRPNKTRGKGAPRLGINPLYRSPPFYGQWSDQNQIGSGKKKTQKRRWSPIRQKQSFQRNSNFGNNILKLKKKKHSNE